MMQAIYAKCEINGNEYLLLEYFVDVQKDLVALSMDKQKVINNGREYLYTLC